jgi:predicted secreted hydrolase
VYLAHFAITDVARGSFRFAEKYSRGAAGLAGAQANPFKVWIDNWTLESRPLAADRLAAAPPTAESPGDWRLHAQGSGYDLSVDLRPLLAPVLNGERGLSVKSAEPGAASYYYSIPRIAVQGRLLRGTGSLDVHGLAWLDREWGSGALGVSQQGWDWFALQLQDGSALMFYSLRSHDGTRDPHSAGTWVDSAGRVKPLKSGDVRIEVSDYWISPRGGRYPSRWRLLVPAVALDAEVRPVLANQELGTTPRYWEGAVDVQGTQAAQSTSGRGYVELVGYAQ